LHDIIIYRPYIYRVGSFEEGALISIAAPSEAASGEIWIYAGVLDQELFEEGFALLADEALELTGFSDTKISGGITVRADGLLYTSIPHSGLWRAFVDGAEVEIITIDGAMAAVWLSAGEHSIVFRYHNSFLMAGIIVSIAAALVLIAIKYNRRLRTYLLFLINAPKFFIL
jgi:uncharacterized membrane protein YfhO